MRRTSLTVLLTASGCTVPSTGRPPRRRVPPNRPRRSRRLSNQLSRPRPTGARVEVGQLQRDPGHDHAQPGDRSRRGDQHHLNPAQRRMTPPTGQRLGIQMTGEFSDGQYATLPGSNRKVPDDGFYVDGAYLLDTANKRCGTCPPATPKDAACAPTPSSVFMAGRHVAIVRCGLQGAAGHHHRRRGDSARRYVPWGSGSAMGVLACTAAVVVAPDRGARRAPRTRLQARRPVGPARR